MPVFYLRPPDVGMSFLVSVFFASEEFGQSDKISAAWAFDCTDEEAYVRKHGNVWNCTLR